MRDGEDNPGGEIIRELSVALYYRVQCILQNWKSLGNKREWESHYTECTMPCGADLTG